MLYLADEFGRYSHAREDLNIEMYTKLGFIPSHVTDIPPPDALPNHEVVFNGREWVQVQIENGEES
jgi:hypothetical protein